jgi:hypothetical protein
MPASTTPDRVLALYDRALEGCLERRLAQVSDAVVGLIGTLDFKTNATAGHFYRLYDFCLWKCRAGQFDKAMWILSDLREAWARQARDRRPAGDGAATPAGLAAAR